MTDLTHREVGKSLQGKLSLCRPALAETASALWGSPNLAQLYPDYLATMHMVVRSALPLMHAALTELPRANLDGKTVETLTRYLLRHIEEERGHDLWLREDIAETGNDPDALCDQMPLPAIATLVGSQYYWIHHFNPVVILGHIGAMEGNAPPVGFAEMLSERTGYPMTAFRTIERHARLDQAHGRELFAMLDGLSLTAEEETWIGVSAFHTIDACIDVLAGLTPPQADADAATRPPDGR